MGPARVDPHLDTMQGRDPSGEATIGQVQHVAELLAKKLDHIGDTIAATPAWTGPHSEHVAAPPVDNLAADWPSHRSGDGSEWERRFGGIERTLEQHGGLLAQLAQRLADAPPVVANPLDAFTAPVALRAAKLPPRPPPMAPPAEPYADPTNAARYTPPPPAGDAYGTPSRQRVAADFVVLPLSIGAERGDHAAPPPASASPARQAEAPSGYVRSPDSQSNMVMPPPPAG